MLQKKGNLPFNKVVTQLFMDGESYGISITPNQRYDQLPDVDTSAIGAIFYFPFILGACCNL